MENQHRPELLNNLFKVGMVKESYLISETIYKIFTSIYQLMYLIKVPVVRKAFKNTWGQCFSKYMYDTYNFLRDKPLIDVCQKYFQ